ncbi:hypothetical protein PFNF54_00950 [Plasmodium falciparum NF54]|nr:hypothetical protein PFNF54_00950 [Plasmodium falciparum NF54]
MNGVDVLYNKDQLGYYKNSLDDNNNNNNNYNNDNIRRSHVSSCSYRRAHNNIKYDIKEGGSDNIYTSNIKRNKKKIKNIEEIFNINSMLNKEALKNYYTVDKTILYDESFSKLLKGIFEKNKCLFKLKENYWSKQNSYYLHLKDIKKCRTCLNYQRLLFHEVINLFVFYVYKFCNWDVLKNYFDILINGSEEAIIKVLEHFRNINKEQIDVIRKSYNNMYEYLSKSKYEHIDDIINDYNNKINNMERKININRIIDIIDIFKEYLLLIQQEIHTKEGLKNHIYGKSKILFKNFLPSFNLLKLIILCDKKKEKIENLNTNCFSTVNNMLRNDMIKGSTFYFSKYSYCFERLLDYAFSLTITFENINFIINYIGDVLKLYEVDFKNSLYLLVIIKLHKFINNLFEITKVREILKTKVSILKNNKYYERIKLLYLLNCIPLIYLDPHMNVILINESYEYKMNDDDKIIFSKLSPFSLVSKVVNHKLRSVYTYHDYTDNLENEEPIHKNKTSKSMNDDTKSVSHYEETKKKNDDDDMSYDSSSDYPKDISYDTSDGSYRDNNNNGSGPNDVKQMKEKGIPKVSKENAKNKKKNVNVNININNKNDESYNIHNKIKKDNIIAIDKDDRKTLYYLYNVNYCFNDQNNNNNNNNNNMNNSNIFGNPHNPELVVLSYKNYCFYIVWISNLLLNHKIEYESLIYVYLKIYNNTKHQKASLLEEHEITIILYYLFTMWINGDKNNSSFFFYNEEKSYHEKNNLGYFLKDTYGNLQYINNYSLITLLKELLSRAEFYFEYTSDAASRNYDISCIILDSSIYDNEKVKKSSVDILKKFFDNIYITFNDVLIKIPFLNQILEFQKIHEFLKRFKIYLDEIICRITLTEGNYI